MKTDPDLFQLFGSETELSAWEARIQQGRLPTRDQLKTILLANRHQPWPEWLIDVVIMGIEGELKGTRGRRRATPLATIRWAVAKAKYEDVLSWLQKRERLCGLQGWSLLQGKHWWDGPPHVRAARIVIARLDLNMDYPAFLNRISSDKSADSL
jgi:hypothetical protein